MDLKLGGITKKLEDNAAILAFAGSAYSRQPDITALINHFTNLNTEGISSGSGNYGALGEAILTLTDMQQLKYKLIDSDHLYTTLFKVGIGAYLASEFGIIGAKWKSIGKDIAKGAGAAAIVLPGSGPRSNSNVTDSNFLAAPTINSMQGAYY